MWGNFKDILEGRILTLIYSLKSNLLTSLLNDQNPNMSLEVILIYALSVVVI